MAGSRQTNREKERTHAHRQTKQTDEQSNEQTHMNRRTQTDDERDGQTCTDEQTNKQTTDIRSD